MYNPYNYTSGMNNIGVAPYMPAQPMQNNTVQPAFNTQTNGLIRVTGMEGAKAYQMAPNSITALFDSNEDIFYVKSTDGAGFPTIKSYQFTEITKQSNTEQASGDFVSRQEFEQFKTEVMNNGKQSISKRNGSNSKQDKPANDE